MDCEELKMSKECLAKVGTSEHSKSIVMNGVKIGKFGEIR